MGCERSKMRKLRLLLFSECNRSCEGCCNKDWDLKSLPIVKSYEGYDEIMLTGDTIINIKKQNNTAKIYLYTALTKKPMDIEIILSELDGIVITLHEPIDAFYFHNFINCFKCHRSRIYNYKIKTKSLKN